MRGCGLSCTYHFINDYVSSFPQLTTQTGVLMKVGAYEDNGEVFEDCSSKWQQYGHAELI